MRLDTYYIKHIGMLNEQDDFETMKRRAVWLVVRQTIVSDDDKNFKFHEVREVDAPVKFNRALEILHRRVTGEELFNEYRMFEIWAEGYSATGDSAKANMIGTCPGTTFEEAVNEYFRRNPGIAELFDHDKLTYWNCKLYPTEEEARVNYG